MLNAAPNDHMATGCRKLYILVMPCCTTPLIKPCIPNSPSHQKLVKRTPPPLAPNPSMYETHPHDASSCNRRAMAREEEGDSTDAHVAYDGNCLDPRMSTDILSIVAFDVAEPEKTLNPHRVGSVGGMTKAGGSQRMKHDNKLNARCPFFRQKLQSSRTQDVQGSLDPRTNPRFDCPQKPFIIHLDSCRNQSANIRRQEEMGPHP